MSELIDARTNGQNFRWRLLTSVSALALMGSVYGGQPASASDDDTDRPTVWIELGGQLERMDSPQAPFAPPFFNLVTNGGFKFKSPVEAGRSSIYSNGGEAAISFMPEGSDWVFSGSVRYGRSDGHRFLHQELKSRLCTPQTVEGFHVSPCAGTPYAQTTTKSSATHIIADFQVGKDVGLGMFGSESTSIVGFGIRIAQFSAKSDGAVYAQPDDHFAPGYIFGFPILLGRHHRYSGSDQRAASFRGIGPSVSWNGSTPFIGSLQDGEIALDWGANAAVLFGRQKSRVHYHTYGTYYYQRSAVSSSRHVLPTHHYTGARQRMVVVPNVGGFAGLSFRFAAAKISAGYRADFFFGAMDGGIDAARKENQGFYGPFASVSIGIGG